MIDELNLNLQRHVKKCLETPVGIDFLDFINCRHKHTAQRLSRHQYRARCILKEISFYINLISGMTDEKWVSKYLVLRCLLHLFANKEIHAKAKKYSAIYKLVSDYLTDLQTSEDVATTFLLGEYFELFGIVREMYPARIVPARIVPHRLYARCLFNDDDDDLD